MLGNLHVAFGGRLLRATSVVDPTRLVPRSSRGGATKYIKDLQQIVVSPFSLGILWGYQTWGITGNYGDNIYP